MANVCETAHMQLVRHSPTHITERDVSNARRTVYSARERNRRHCTTRDTRRQATDMISACQCLVSVRVRLFIYMTLLLSAKLQYAITPHEKHTGTSTTRPVHLQVHT